MSNSNTSNGVVVNDHPGDKPENVSIDVTPLLNEVAGNGDEVDGRNNNKEEELITPFENIELNSAREIVDEKEESPIEDEIIQQKLSNTYAAKKTVAQGMMDIALITANANQLRYIVEFTRNSPTFYLVVTLIVISLMLQIAVGVCLIFKGRLDLRGRSKDPKAKVMNNYVVVGVFLVTIINVFVASFTTTGTTTQTQNN